MRKRILFLILFSLSASAANEVPRQPFMAGPMAFLPRFTSIPQRPLFEQIYPGLRQRGEANQILVHDLYGEQKLLDRFPRWKKIVPNIPGFWPELVGHLGDPYLANFYGPDLWALQGKTGSARFRVGEENGSNVGGAESALFFLQYARQHPELFGNSPYLLYQSPYEAWIERLRRLTEDHFFQRKQGKIVMALEASRQATPLEMDGVPVEMPFPLGPELIEKERNEMARLGVEAISLIDEKGRIFVEDDILYLKNLDGSKDRIDTLIYFADVEACDPLHEPQIRRNIEMGQERYNREAKVWGVPGLVKAWMAKKDGGFIWVGNPTSLLKRSKMTPILTDEYLRATHREIPLPYQDTFTLFDENGVYQESRTEEWWMKRHERVLKYAVGSGGKQVIFPGEMPDEALATHFAFARQNPFSVIAQPIVELAKIRMNFVDGAAEDRIFDIRMVNLLIGAGDNYQFYGSRVPTVRIAKQGAKRVNISGGGFASVGVPTYEGDFEILAPMSLAEAQAVAPCIRELLIESALGRPFPMAPQSLRP